MNNVVRVGIVCQTPSRMCLLSFGRTCHDINILVFFILTFQAKIVASFRLVFRLDWLVLCGLTTKFSWEIVLTQRILSLKIPRSRNMRKKSSISSRSKLKSLVLFAALLNVFALLWPNLLT
jgi:hypothetical protein